MAIESHPFADGERTGGKEIRSAGELVVDGKKSPIQAQPTVLLSAVLARAFELQGGCQLQELILQGAGILRPVLPTRVIGRRKTVSGQIGVGFIDAPKPLDIDRVRRRAAIRATGVQKEKCCQTCCRYEKYAFESQWAPPF